MLESSGKYTFMSTFKIVFKRIIGPTLHRDPDSDFEGASPRREPRVPEPYNLSS